MENLKFKIEENFQEQISDLKEIISFNSVNEFDHAPFGLQINECLKSTLNLFAKNGFTTFLNEEGYYGYAEIGQGELIGVLCHLDVVCANELEKWYNNPFELYIKDNIAYGRGVQDDKGPTIACLYAIKALQNLNLNFTKRIRFIFGTDEETLWRCINEYIKNEEIPKYGFAPDATFPLIKAEKGLLQVKIFAKNETGLNLKGGTGLNVVPNLMEFPNDLKEFVKKYNYEFENNFIIGKSVHAQNNHLGINSISRFLNILNYKYNSKLSNFVIHELNEDPHALKIFGNLKDFSGTLSFNIGKINFSEFEEIYVDIRYPVTYTKEFILEKLEILNKYQLKYAIIDYLKPLNISENSFIIQNLLKPYQEITKDYTKPLVIGGATYARSMPNFVAFGASFKHSLKTAHQVNERLDLDDFKNSTLIYANAFLNIIKN